MPVSTFTPSLNSGAKKVFLAVVALLAVLRGGDVRAQGGETVPTEKPPEAASERKSPSPAPPEAKATTQEPAQERQVRGPEIVGGGSPQSSVEPAGPDPDLGKKESPNAATQATAGAGGVVVFVDPATGKIRQPEAEEIGRLVAPDGAKVITTAPLVQKALPGGGVGIVLDSSFDSFLVVTKQPDGKLSMGCVSGEEKAEDAVTKGADPALRTEAQAEVPDGK